MAFLCQPSFSGLNSKIKTDRNNNYYYYWNIYNNECFKIVLDKYIINI